MVRSQANRSVRAATDGNRYAVEYQEGPLPDPLTLEKYEQIVPGAARQIVAAFVTQTHHRQDLEQKVITANISAAKRAQYFALVVALGGLGASTVMAVAGAEQAAGIVGGATLVGLVSVFITGRASQTKERASQRGR